MNCFETFRPLAAACRPWAVVGLWFMITMAAAARPELAVHPQATLKGILQTSPWSFKNHVQPILAKTGCSSGACHGAAAGQNGFKLSLRGYDDAGDHLALTRHARARRIVPEDPARSLLLLKATGAVPHKGGKRFDTNSLEYQILADWIANGTPGPRAEDPQIQRIEILPPHVVLRPGETQELLVRAHFNNGTVEDVTRWVKFSEANSAVTQVNENGKVTVMGPGEGPITAWYLSRIAIATVTVPYTNAIARFPRVPTRNFIDRFVLEKLRALNLVPSPRCSDEEFIRRAFLDTLGVLPGPEETRRFLSSKDPKKRDRLIEQLVERPEFVDYWTYKWSDLLLVQSKKLKPPAMWAYYYWIRKHVAANTPWDKMVRELITAQGSTLENGAGNFFVLHEDPRLMAETTSQAFLGMSINCAKCHNHPMEKWTNDEYFGFANLFARVRMKNGPAEGDQVIFVAERGDLVQPLRGRPQPPKPLDGIPLPLEDPEDRREHLAQWLTAPENPYFARAIVNRVWANYLGVGLVESVDDLRMTNPSSNEKLFGALTGYLIEQQYDLKALMKLILQSETYQRASQPLPENAGDSRFYSRYYPRRLMAEVLLDAYSQATDSATKFPNYPEGWRALKLPDSNVNSYFLQAFGRPERENTCECERRSEPNVRQVLHIANGDTLNKKLGAKDNVIDRWLDQKFTPEQIVEEIFITALSRYPRSAEKAKLVEVLKSSAPSEIRAAIEDVYWAVLSSKEFLFNH